MYTSFLKTKQLESWGEFLGRKANETPEIAYKILNVSLWGKSIDFTNCKRKYDLEMINDSCIRAFLHKMWSTWELGRNVE